MWATLYSLFMWIFHWILLWNSVSALAPPSNEVIEIKLFRASYSGPSVGGGGPGYVATALIAIAIAYSVGGSRVIVATKGTDRWHQKIRGYYRHRFAGGRSHSVYNIYEHRESNSRHQKSCNPQSRANPLSHPVLPLPEPVFAQSYIRNDIGLY